MIHDTLAAMAQLKALPLRWRILSALLAAEGDEAPAQVSLRDLAELTGVGERNARQVNREATSLVRDGLLDRLRVGGTGANVYRVRDPKDWPSGAWRSDRASALAASTAIAQARAVRKADIFASEPRAQRPVVRAVTRALATQMAAGELGVSGASARGHARTSDEVRDDHHYLPKKELRSSLSKEGIEPSNEPERSTTDELAAAVIRGCRSAGNERAFLSPAQRKRIAHVALEANGRYGALLEEARRPDGPRSTLARIELLELLLVEDAPAHDHANAARERTQRTQELIAEQRRTSEECDPEASRAAIAEARAKLRREQALDQPPSDPPGNLNT